MIFELIKEIIEKNLDHVDFATFGEGASDLWIDLAQKRLGNRFPPSYIWWLKNYGGGEIHGEEVYSVYEMDFDSVVGGDIVYVNELKRKEGIFNDETLVIQVNDQGEAYYLDLSVSDEDGENPVYIDIDSSKYADNFLEFILKKIDEV